MAESRISHELFLDPSVNLEDLSRNKLIIELHDDNLRFAIYEPDSDIFTGCGSIKAPAGSGGVASILANNEWLKGNTLKTEILIGTGKNTLVPESLYNRGRTDQYIDFNFLQDQKSVIKVDDVPWQVSKNIYTIPYPVFLLVSKTWPQAGITHLSTVLTEGLLKAMPSEKDHDTILAYLDPQQITVASRKGNDLRFFNTFEYHSEEDALFYLLVAIDQLGLNPASEEVIYAGDIDKESDIYALFSKYIEQLAPAPSPENFYYARELEKVKRHKYVPLFYSLLCV